MRNNCKPIKVDGIEFESIKDAAIFHSLDPKTVRMRISRLGWSINEAFGVSKRKPSKTAPKQIVLKGKKYKSIAEAARCLSKDYNKINLRINRGWTIKEAFNIKKRKRQNGPVKVKIKGKNYDSLAAASRACGIKYRKVYQRIKDRWTVEEALEIVSGGKHNPRNNKISVCGIEYPNIAKAAEKFGIPAFKVYNRLRKGWTYKEAFGLEKRKGKNSGPKQISVNGIYYSSISKAAREFGFNPGLIRSRLSSGWTPEEAFEIVNRKDGTKNSFGIVYLVTNRLNGKKYIGVTMSTLRKRWRNHIKQSLNGCFSKHSLQADIAQFGPDKFDKSVIDRADNQSELTLKEIQWVKKENTKFPAGYNLTRGGGGINNKGDSIIVEGIEYPSIVKAAEAYKLPYHLVIGRLHTSNWSVEEAFGLCEKKFKGMPKEITVENITYPNVSEAAKEYGIDYQLIHQRLNNGWSIEESFELKTKNYYGKPVQIHINNKKYESINDAAREFGLDPSKARYRLKSGWSVREAFGIKKREIDRSLPPNCKPVTVEGVEYPNITKAAKAYKINYYKVYSRLSKGWSVEEAFNLAERNYRPATSKSITVEGNTFPTIKEAAIHYRFDPRIIRSRLNTLKWPIEKAFELDQ